MQNEMLESAPHSFRWNESELRFISCPDCHADRHVPVLKRHDGLLIVRCARCGMAFVYPQPSTDELSRFYKSGYFGGNSDFHRGTDYFEQRQKGIEAGKLTGASLLANLDLMGLRVVEIGAADGALLAWCKSRGAADAIGIEFSEEAAAWGRAQYGLTMICSTLDENAFPAGSVDLVIAIDLIEHLQNPKSLMASCARWLVSGGRLAILCPNGSAISFWGKRWIGVQENMEHLTYLTRRQFVGWAKEFQFVLERHSYEGCPLRRAQYQSAGSRTHRILREPHRAAYNATIKLLTAVMPASSRHQQEMILMRL
jgi:2-polyprenyl-3-methyl-5-hydroxy-6-metoxy-1,4-benzoquinol methylase